MYSIYIMSKRKVRGGSIASDRVNVLSPKLCNCNYQYPDAVRSVMAKDFVVKNYGSSYKTTGGGNVTKKKNNLKGNWFTNKFIPQISLKIFKGSSNKQVLNEMKNLWEKNNNKKLSDKSATNMLNELLSENKHLNKQMNGGGKSKKLKGGRVLLPMKWFNPEYRGTYISERVPGVTYSCADNKLVAKSFPSMKAGKKQSRKNKKGGGGSGYGDATSNGAPASSTGEMRGWAGDSVLTGANVPQNGLQKLSNFYRGESTLFAPSRSDPANASGLEVKCNSTDCSAISSVGSGDSDGLSNPKAKVGAIGDVPGLDAYTYPPDELTYKFADYKLPKMMAGKKKNRKNKKGGASSDWRSTVMSRGSYTAPNMGKDQFNYFTKDGKYISNTDLANGAAKNFKTSPFVYNGELYNQKMNKGGNIPQGYNSGGVSTNQYGNGAVKKFKDTV